LTYGFSFLFLLKFHFLFQFSLYFGLSFNFKLSTTYEIFLSVLSFFSKFFYHLFCYNFVHFVLFFLIYWRNILMICLIKTYSLLKLSCFFSFQPIFKACFPIFFNIFASFIAFCFWAESVSVCLHYKCL
jgi:hypothetical protein